MAKIEMVINVPVTITLEQLPEEDLHGTFHRAAEGLQHWAKECTKRTTNGYPLVLVQSRVVTG